MFARRVLQTTARRAYATTVMVRAEAAASTSSDCVVNFCTPHEPIYANKVVDQLIIPGADGEYGVTAGISPIISELIPGVVTVMHQGGDVEKFFIAGGFAVTHANSVTDLSVTEAFPLGDFDEASVKTNYAEAVKNSTQGDEAAQAAAKIEAATMQALGRAMGVTL